MKALLAGAGLVAIAGNWAVPMAAKVVHRRRFVRRVAHADAVHLTFDDGPHPDATPRILDLLAEHGATASFFVVGQNVDAHPQIVERTLAEGHVVGSHGYLHSHAWRTSPWDTAHDLAQGRTVLAGLGGGELGSQWFRPPFGKLNYGSLRFLSPRTAWWTVDPFDYECATGDEVLAGVEGRLSPGAVVLLHDGRLDGDSPQPTIDGVRQILEAGRREGLRFESLAALG